MIGSSLSLTRPNPLASGPVGPHAGNLVVIVLDETTASLTVSTNGPDGDVYAVAIDTTTGTVPPSVAQVLAGQDGAGSAAAWNHNQGVSSSGTQTLAGGITGLTEGETYRAYAVYQDGNGDNSAVVATADFVPGDVTAPFISSLDLAKSGSDDWSGTVNTDTGEGLLDVVITTSATAPSPVQIKTGQTHLGVAAADSIADQAVSSSGVQTLSGNGALSGATEYWGHAVHTDAAGNTSDVLSVAASFTTDIGATVPDAFVDADWSVATGSGSTEIDIAIASLPADNGAAITDVEFEVDSSGVWIFLSYSGTGTYTATMAAGDTAYDIRLRAVNSAGSGAAGNTETATSGASSLSGIIAITTSLNANQVWQRDRANLTLAGTYSLNADPSGMEWRVGSGDWVPLASETIGSDAWSGTLDIPFDYLAQGQLQVRPVGAPSITDTHDDVTVTDVFAILGDSMTAGISDASDSYTGTLTWVEYSGGSWSAVTGQTSIWPQLANNLDTAGIPPAFARYGSSGSAFRPYLGGSAGGSWRASPDNGDTNFYYANGRDTLDDGDTGGFKALLWEAGPNDAIDNNTFYEQDLKDLINALQSDVSEMSGVKMIVSIIGEVDENETGLADVAHLTALRSAQLSAIATDADILRGPSWIDLDMGDGVHIGKAPAGLAQQELAGNRWWRAVAAHFYSGTDAAAGAAITSATVSAENQITITFDQAMANHTDTTGWDVQDNTGMVGISSAAQGGSTSQVVLTLASDLRTKSGEVEDVLVSFGEGNDAVGSTLRDTKTVYFPAEFTVDADAGEAYAYNMTTPALDGTPTVGAAVTCDGGTWESTSSITFSYQWREAAGGAAISGATSASYTPVAGDSAYLNTMVCDVTATNSKGAVTATSGTGAYSPATVFDGGREGGWWRPDVIGDLFQLSTGATAVAADGDPVGYIADAGGNGNHMKQATASARLTYDTDATYVNVFGDGSHDYLGTDGFASSASEDVLAIVAADWGALDGTVMTFANGSATKKAIQIEHNRIVYMSNDFNGTANTSIAPSGHAVVTVVATEADKTFRIYVNGVLVASPTKSGSGWFGANDKTVFLGRRVDGGFPDYTVGGINQGLVVTGANVADERAALETYFGNLIGLSL